MNIIKKYRNFKITIEDMPIIGKIICATDEDGQIWHDVQVLEKGIPGTFVMTLNGEIIAINNDNTKLVPVEKSNIYYVDNCLNNVGDYVKEEDNKLIQVDVSGYIHPSVNEDTGEIIENATLDELQETKTNLILQHNKKRKEISVLNEESEYFDVSESLSKVNKELEEIRAKINEIDKVIEEMNKQQ